MDTNTIMDYMRKQLSQICNEKNNRNRQEVVTETLQKLDNLLSDLEEDVILSYYQFCVIKQKKKLSK